MQHLIRVNDKYILFLIIFFLGISCKSNRDRCLFFNSKYSETLARQGDFPDTVQLIKVLDNIILSDNNCIDAYLTRADLYAALHENFNAKKDYKKVITLDSSNLYALYKIGLIFQDEEKYDSSINYFQWAIRNKIKGDYIVDYSSANKNIIPDNKYDIESFKLIYQQGVSFYYNKNFHSALKNFDYCIYNNYELGKCYLYRGTIRVGLNQKEDACNDFRQSMSNGNAEAILYIKKYCK